MTTRHRIPCFFTISLVLLVAGCSDKAAKEVTMRKACLAKLGLAYHGFRDSEGRSPTGIEELATYIAENTDTDSEVDEEAMKRLREHDIVMFWSAALKESGDENEEYVLGYEPAIPRSGGYLVTGGGSVVLVSPKSYNDFKEYPQQSDSDAKEDVDAAE